MQAVTITQISPPELETLIEKTISKCLSGNKPTTTQPATDQLLTISQVAEFLSLSVPTVYGLVSRSVIPCMKKGKRLYFSKDEISDWIKTGKKKTICELSADVDSFHQTQLKKYQEKLKKGQHDPEDVFALNGDSLFEAMMKMKTTPEGRKFLQNMDQKKGGKI
jgi:excisionase family DNA binding protein